MRGCRADRHKSPSRWQASARELPNLALEDALSLVRLYGGKESPKYQKAALRWLERYLTEGSPRLEHFADLTSELAKLAREETSEFARSAVWRLGAHRRLAGDRSPPRAGGTPASYAVEAYERPALDRDRLALVLGQILVFGIVLRRGGAAVVETLLAEQGHTLGVVRDAWLVAHRSSFPAW
jgi:hypothetical protein